MDCSTQASLSIINSQSLLKLMFIEVVMPSNHLIFCCSLLLLPSIFPSIRIFSNKSIFFASGGQIIGASASALVLPVNMKDWFPLGLTGLIPSQESSPTPQFKSITSLVLSFLYGSNFTSTHNYWKNIVNFNFILYCLEQKLPFSP